MSGREQGLSAAEGRTSGKGIIEGTAKPLDRVIGPFIGRTRPFVGFLLGIGLDPRTVTAGRLP